MAAEIEGRDVTVRVGGGKKRWKGRVESVNPTGLVLASKKRTETLPRDSVVEIEYRRTLGARGRIVGTVAGVGAGVPVVVFAEIYQRNETSSPRIRGAALSIAAVAAAAGYFLGRERDVERVVLRISRP
ncbi:MAG: hypothetical protein R2762_27840 [Bryobacteraceae bacterium]